MRVDLYVSRDGNDEWPGTRREPLRTLDRAKELARGFHEHSVHAEIYLRSGPYWISSRLIPGPREAA